MLNTETLQITPELLNLIARIDEFKGAWRALGTLAPERLAALRRVATLESMIEMNKEAYGLALRQTQGTIRTGAPDWQPWLLFFPRSLAEQVRRLEKKVEREKLVLAALPELALQIVEPARGEHGRVRMGEVVKLTGASRNTLKEHFRTLVERGYLNQHGAGRSVWYELR
jgi:Fic family protein